MASATARKTNLLTDWSARAELILPVLLVCSVGFVSLGIHQVPE